MIPHVENQPGQIISFTHEQVFRTMSSDVVLHGLSRLIEEGKDAAFEIEDPKETDWYFGLYESVGTLVDPANVDNQPATVGEEAYRARVRRALGYMEFVGVAAENLSASGIYDAYRREVRVPESIGKPEGIIFLSRDIAAEKASRRMRRRHLVSKIEEHLDAIGFDELDRLMKRYTKLPPYTTWKTSQEKEARRKYKEYAAAQRVLEQRSEMIAVGS